MTDQPQGFCVRRGHGDISHRTGNDKQRGVIGRLAKGRKFSGVQAKIHVMIEPNREQGTSIVETHHGGKDPQRGLVGVEQGVGQLNQVALFAAHGSTQLGRVRRLQEGE